MTDNRIPHLVEKSGGRFYWQPSAGLRGAGWRPLRLAAGVADPFERRLEAMRQAKQLNDVLLARRLATGARYPAPDGAPPAAEAERPIAGAPVAREAGRSLGDLIDAYQASPRFLRLARSTQAMYAENLRTLRAWAGDQPAAALKPEHVQALYEAWQPRWPTKANHLVTVLRLLLSHGQRHGWVQANAAAKPGLIATPYSGRLWSPVALACIVAQADRSGRHSIGTACRLNYWMGQREGDLLRLPLAAYAGGVIRLTQAKTLAKVALPVDDVPMLKARLSAELANRAAILEARGGQGFTAAATTLLLCEATGRPWLADYFQHELARVRQAAAARARARGNAPLVHAIEAALFRHLRHTAIVRWSERGASLQLIGSITGHSPRSIHAVIGHYWQPTTEQAAAAFKLRLAR